MLTINNTLDGYLKDVEIKGNTTQDSENLADIRSVGDKVEGQELYEIPVLSCGKNLLNIETSRKDVLLNIDTGGLFDSDIYEVSDYIKVCNGKKYQLKNPLGWYYCLYDLDKKFIKRIDFPFIAEQDGYVRISYKKTDRESIQLEEGTVATPYEPYVEDKLTILSPVQLEKVGDVADRIIEKDGVWGVEKNIATVIFDGSENWVRYHTGQKHLNCYSVTIPNVKSVFVISNKFKYGKNAWDNESEDCMSGHTLGAIYVAKQDIASELDFKTWLQANPTTVKYATTNPQFIPLPHDQQVKLRTFANKTNISFLTEIEGTIKAQVPKSLGATVNTHTEQINNLNKELDRVKKLEESTVSTVTTESDFTTVEATSNGYFEDVKLEGKTLVNLASMKDWVIGNGSSYNKENNMIISEENAPANKPFGYKRMNLKGNTVYTVLGNLTTNVARLRFGKGVTSAYWFNIITTSSSNFIQTFKTDVSGEYEIALYVNGVDNLTQQISCDNVIILEGDHTQNPPSYFEGLKSVGQSTSEDGADEIVVSSVKGDGNLFDLNVFETLKDINNWSGDAYKNSRVLAKLKPNTTYTMTIPELCVAKNSYWLVEFMDAGKSVANVFNWSHNNSQNSNDLVAPSRKVTFTTSSGHLYINAYMDNWANLQIMCNYLKTNFMLEEGTQAKPYTPHQSDKKRLLYYNNETQTWEKPILREWDSIEKHANGKYYYHQRSGEVVLNGSENWNIITTTEGYPRFWSVSREDIKHNSSIICDRFNSKTYNVFSSFVGEGITIKDTSCEIQIKIKSDKLSTQDIQGFKQWLQANPTTVVYQLAQEKVYECTNIDLITYANETNYVVESGAIAPKTTLKVHNNISNVVSLLQKKVSLLESNVTSYMITQNRLMLASRYNADTVSFKVDVASLRDTFEYDNDLYELILNNILVGKDNYNREYIENLIIFYWMDFIISDEMYSTLFEIIEEQHNPKIEEETPLI